MGKSSSNTSRTVIVCVALILLTLAVYWPTITFGYVDYDDPWHAASNVYVRSGLTWEGVKWAFTSADIDYWHPLSWLSLMLDTSVLGDHPMGHHLTNVAMHVANVLLLLTLLLSMTGALWRSALVAALLAVHPTHVESVAWITERKDVLSLFFWLLTMLAYVKFVRGGRTWRDNWVMIILYVLALMSKPMVLTLPCALLLLDVWPLARTRMFSRESSPSTRPIAAPFNEARPMIRLVLEKVPMLALSVVSALITMHGTGVGTLLDGVVAPWPERLANAVVSYPRYLGSLFCPCDLAVLYPNQSRIGRVMWEPWQWMGSAILIAIVSAGTLALIRRRPYLAVGWLWFLGTIVPVLGLVQVGRQSMADRFAYIPFIGLYLALTWLIGDFVLRLPKLSRILVITGLATTVLALAVAAHRQVWVWKDSRTLFEHTLAVTSDNWIMHINLSRVLEAEGDVAGTTKQYELALAIYPACTWARTYYGVLLGRSGRLYDAELEFRRTLEFDPDYAPAWMNLGNVLIKRSQVSSAIDAFRRAVEIDPAMAEARMMLAVGLSQQGLFTEAVRHMEEAVRLRPDNEKQWNPMLDAMRRGSSVGFP